MKDEINILSDDKKKTRIQNQIREKEKQEDKKERKIEIDKNSKRLKEYNDVINMKKLKLKKILYKIYFIKPIFSLFILINYYNRAINEKF